MSIEWFLTRWLLLYMMIQTCFFNFFRLIRPAAKPGVLESDSASTGLCTSTPQHQEQSWTNHLHHWCLQPCCRAPSLSVQNPHQPLSSAGNYCNLTSFGDFFKLSFCNIAVIFIVYQVDETVDWLSDYFMRSRLNKQDLRSFGLYSSWTPYVNYVVFFWDHLIGCLINVQLSSCARESVGSSKIIKGGCRDYIEGGQRHICRALFIHVLHSHSYTRLTQQDCEVIQTLDFSFGHWWWRVSMWCKLSVYSV